MKRWIALAGLFAVITAVVALSGVGCASRLIERREPVGDVTLQKEAEKRDDGRVVDYTPVIESFGYIAEEGAGVGGGGGAYGVHSHALNGPANSDREELWVIAGGRLGENRKSSEQAGTQIPAPEEPPGTGSLLAKIGEQQVPIPLKHTDIKASIAGYIAAVDVTQQYHNPFDTKIEAVYVFPLPQNAAINEFVMTIGDRKIRGIIREREEAEKIYQQAKRQGYTASLLTQERPNIFTQSVANIAPGKQIDINIRYYHTLAYADGWYEWVFPMVVGPRFNPPGSTDGVGAVGRGDRGLSGQPTEIEYLKPDERSGHDISLAVQLDAGVKLENVACTSHVSAIHRQGENGASVVLSDADSIPNKDFILRYQVAGQQSKSGLVTFKDERGGYFALMLYPPSDLASLSRRPVEMVFTVDVSGSMSGRPIEQARAAMRVAMENMRADDTLQVIQFASDASKLFDMPQPATPENIDRARAWIEQMHSGGGTMMIEGIRASLNFLHDRNRVRLVSFLTDGYIGNEREILGEIHNNIGPARIFSFGVGSSVNRYLMEHMAKIGQGEVAYLSLKDDAREVMGKHFERISHPAMMNIEVDWGGMQVSEVYPQRIPDLFVGRPVILTGRYTGRLEGMLRVKGTVGDHSREMIIQLSEPQPTPAHKALPAIWARTKMADLYDRTAWEENNEVPQQVRTIALQYGLMTAYTAFVAVDSSQRSQGETGVTVNVPVPAPDGVKYETTVQETPR